MTTVESIPMDPSRLVDFLTDDETSLLARGYFMLRLEEEFKKSWRYGWSYALLVVDVEGFTELEQKEGERAVRSARLDICGEILSASRDTDLSARLDGRRFAILLPGTGDAGARAFVERVVNSIREGAFGRYKVSVGGCVSPDSGLKSADDFLELANRACEEAREQGDGSYVVADASKD